MNLCRRQQQGLAFWVAAFTMLCANAALAGPPFLTDDPSPVDYGDCEAYIFSTLDQAADGTEVASPAFEFNYGAAPNFMFHSVLPIAYENPDSGPTAYGLADAELGFQYRFIEERDDFPELGTFIMLEIPTGDRDRGLGNGELWAKFPLWLKKTFGPWTVYGGGGYAVNNAPDKHNFPFGGLVVQRDFTKKITLGGELYMEGSTEDGGDSSAVVNFGGYYNFTEQTSMLFSIGHSIDGDRDLIGYLGLYWTW